MAASPNYKVFNSENQYRASFYDPSEAAVFIGIMGEGWTIRNGHSKRNILWHEGYEEQSASENYDFVLETVSRREKEHLVSLIS